ncbi:hypothetical protein EX895_001076 [Sporisorium graminicola]|uniref:Apple domain-containing protein n=1 Tax=Sporisorium graminicola TaxID=280036 RepID=A0A4V6EUI2_9BASI|nr:hypothetical protein EX895_001076 [Sporisorium graminicola]TKY89779.1 hypothetical protein EX895_001076 [Sporisorium graminicola]
MKACFWTSLSATLAVAMAISVSSSPAYFDRRDDSVDSGSNATVIAVPVDSSVAQYTAPDGSVDLGSLIDDTVVTPIEIPATATTPTVLTFPTAALMASAAAENDVAYTTTVTASAEPTGAVSKRAVPAGTVGQGGKVAAWDASYCPTASSGPGPLLSPDTPDNFSNNQWLNQAYGQSSAAVAPAGYTKAFGPYYQTIQASTATMSLGIYNTYTSYNAADCAAKCNKRSDCAAFAFWMQRDTDINYYGSAAAAGDWQTRCNNPPVSRTNYVCGLYSARVTKEMATNAGQMKGPIFKTAHAAVNAYFKSDPAKDLSSLGYTSQVNQNGIIDNGETHPYLTKTMNANSNPQVSGYAPEYCAAWCNEHKDSCAGFDSASMYRDGKFAGTLCNLYSVAFDNSQYQGKPGQYSTAGYISSSPGIFYTRTPDELPTRQPTMELKVVVA